MNIDNIKKINDITGQIMRLESSINSLKWRLEHLRNNKDFDAEMILETGGKRTQVKFSMTSSEAITVLERNLNIDEIALENFKGQLVN